MMLLNLLLLGAVAASASTLSIDFDSSKDISTKTWKLDETGSHLPADWSPYQFLVVVLKASSPQMFQLSIETAGGPATVRLLPYANAWVRAAIPLNYFEKLPTKGTDMASISNKTHIGYFINLGGPYRPLQAVTGLSVSMQNPLPGAALEIRSVGLRSRQPMRFVRWHRRSSESSPTQSNEGAFILRQSDVGGWIINSGAVKKLRMFPAEGVAIARRSGACGGSRQTFAAVGRGGQGIISRDRDRSQRLVSDELPDANEIAAGIRCAQRRGSETGKERS